MSDEKVEESNKMSSKVRFMDDTEDLGERSDLAAIQVWYLYCPICVFVCLARCNDMHLYVSWSLFAIWLLIVSWVSSYFTSRLWQQLSTNNTILSSILQEIRIAAAAAKKKKAADRLSMGDVLKMKPSNKVAINSTLDSYNENLDPHSKNVRRVAGTIMHRFCSAMRGIECIAE